MRYLIEITPKTEVSKKLLKNLRELQKEDNSIKITLKKEKKFRPLTAKDVVLPGGPKPTDEQWEEYLNRKDRRRAHTIEEVRKSLTKRFKKAKKK